MDTGNKLQRPKRVLGAQESKSKQYAPKESSREGTDRSMSAHWIPCFKSVCLYSKGMTFRAGLRGRVSTEYSSAFQVCPFSHSLY